MQIVIWDVMVTDPLMLCSGIAGLIFLATLMAVVRVRQLYKRQLSGELISRPHIMFPNIQRCHADHDLRSCFKYLLNYGFYKFGVEVGKIVIVIFIFFSVCSTWLKSPLAPDHISPGAMLGFSPILLLCMSSILINFLSLLYSLKA
jgi:hypothetical protein